MPKRALFLCLVIVVAGAAVWAGFRFGALQWLRPQAKSNSQASKNIDAWAEAVEKVKEHRGDPAGWQAVAEIPPELKHYSDRRWFLATQVAEVGKHNVQTSQDFVDLAAMIQRHDMVAVPAVSDTYVLYGVGEEADDKPFSRSHDNQSVDLYDEAQLSNAYKRLDEKRSALQTEIKTLKLQASELKKRDREKQKELQKQITAQQQELSSTNDEKAQLDQFYGRPDSRHKLFRDYEALKSLAKSFAGRSFDLEQFNDRQAMKVSMLSTLRPEALKIMEEVASAYHRQFARLLPVSSLMRPEEYQRALRKVNRNAVLIDTPPHSTGLAFDIDYRYMSAAEQMFVMAELARLEREGRIEAIRERNANYHVFAFIDGMRPGDTLIAASLENATTETALAHHAGGNGKAEVKPQKQVKAAAVKRKPQKSNTKTAKARTRKRR